MLRFPKFLNTYVDETPSTMTWQAKSVIYIHNWIIFKSTYSVNLRCLFSTNRTLITNEPRAGMKYCMSAAFWLDWKCLRNSCWLFNDKLEPSLQNSVNRFSIGSAWSWILGKYWPFSSQPSTNYYKYLKHFLSKIFK